MTDDAFHLTALDARRYDFGNALRGYDRARVDQFRDQVAEELERLSRANQELEAKARNFHEQLRAFRERDKALNDALISAQQLRGEIREQAQREAQLIIREAQGEAERSLDALRGEIRRAEDDLQQLWRNRRGFLQQLRQQMERQLHELDGAEMVPPPPGLAAPLEPNRDALRSSVPQVREFQTLREELSEEGNVKTPTQPPVRPSIPTPSWLDVVDGE
ncbi:MAG: DivIVA domain-containing protein [Phycisphaerae bacterium]|nr:DivIVA domain-containing protein [Gemmatimonadaceae bacterium]